MTRDPARPGGQAQSGCCGQHNTAGKRPKLRLDGGHDVRKAGRASTANGAEIVGQIGEKLDAMGNPQPNSSVRSVDDPRGLVRGQIDAILRLQASVWDDEARVGYIRPIRLDLALGIRAIFGSQALNNVPRERSEQKRDHQREPDGIYDSQLTALRWMQHRAEA